MIRDKDNPGSLRPAESAEGSRGSAAGASMTERQREFARHALGFPNKKNESYRNHFCIGKGGDGYEDWLDLVVKGLAVRRTGPHWGGDDMFYLTLEGALMVREKKEHISREDAEDMRKLESRKSTEAPATDPPASPNSGRTEQPCEHVRLNEDGICRTCGADRRGI